MTRYLPIEIVFALALLFSDANQITVSRQDEFDRAVRNILRLAPASFPALPAAIRRNLEDRGCTIPQAAAGLFDSVSLNNVIQGSFTAARRSEWAILCSIRDTSTVLIYPATGSAPLDSVGREEDRRTLQGQGHLGILYSRVISAISAAQIRAWHAKLLELPRQLLPVEADHDGINDGYMFKGSTILYFHQDRWLFLLGGD